MSPPAAAVAVRRRVTEGSILAPSCLVPVLVFTIGRIVDAVLIASMADGHTGGGDRGYWSAITSADGDWYQRIADHGYPTTLPESSDGLLEQNPWVFFPLYPLIVRGAMTSGLPFALAASLVSLVAGAAAFVILFRLIARHGGPQVALITVVALTAFPAAPAFQLAYTESLALLEITIVLDSAERARYGRALAALCLLALTRPLVIAFAPVFAVAWWLRWRRRKPDTFATADRVGLGVLTIASGALFAVWPTVAGLVTGRADAYVATQRMWLTGSEAEPWRSWLDVALSGELPAASIMVLLALGLCALVLVRRGAQWWGPMPRLFAASYFAYLLVTTRPTSSIFRYAMLALVPWWPLPDLARRLSRAHLAGLCAAIGVVGLVTQAWWIHEYLIRAAGPGMFP